MAANLVTLTPAPASSTRHTLHDTSHTVSFRHPAYPDFRNQNVFLTLPAWDEPGGLHVGTARLACAIIACNARHGYLMSRDRTRVRLDDDALLSDSTYWFYVPPDDALPTEDVSSDPTPYCYPIYPSFADWMFPFNAWNEAQWPPGWADATSPAVPSRLAPATSSVSSAVRQRDGVCLVSQSGDYLERAHLCPRSELDWFSRNGMSCFNHNRRLSGPSVVDDTSNAISLRSDIHTCFDDAGFVLARKRGSWVASFIGPTVTLGRDYHNRILQMDGAVSPAFLLIRFAWAIFPLVKTFFQSGPAKKVKVLEVTEDESMREVIKSYSAVSFAQQYGSTGSNSKSQTSKKRKASEADLLDTTQPEDNSNHIRGSSSSVPSLASDSDRQLSLVEGNAIGASSRPTNYPALRPELLEMERMSALCEQALRAQRPTDPALLCCDYNKPSSLCDVCRGWEME